MNKEELVNTVAEKTGFSKKNSALALDTILETISREVASGNRVVIVGFGTFDTQKRAARTGRNPHTNAEVYIPSAVVPRFKPGRVLRNMVSGRGGSYEET